MSEPTHIRVRGARAHNLQNVDVDVPRNALVVFTGVSGSGKSSLAFDTLYQEGQRRFVESLSPYARQFLGQMERPSVDLVEGISPTLCIDQKTVNRNPRSTVGTVTEIADHLRLLMARLGVPHCPACGREVSLLTLDAVVDDLLAVGAGQRIQVLGPVVRDRKGEYRKELEALKRDGWARVRVDGEIRSFDEEIPLARYEKHTIEVVVDRLRGDLGDRPRLSEAVETAAQLGAGVVHALIEDQLRTYSTQRACPDHPDLSLPEMEPRLFSFNAPQGACSACSGLGVTDTFDVEALVDLEATPALAFRAWNEEGKLAFSHVDRDLVAGLCRPLGLAADRPLRGQDPAAINRLIHGAPDVTYVNRTERPGGRVDEAERAWAGYLPLVQTVWKYTQHRPLEVFRTSRPCAACGGARLNEVARAVTFRGRNLPQLAHLDVHEARLFFRGVQLDATEAEIGALLIQEILDRLAFLDDVGLGYLSLDRSAATLSGGEAQRIRLAAQVGSALQGVTYVLDEPSIGLHPRDNARLLKTLLRLRDRGNSVLVVEHDEETIYAADHVVDVGPGAGREGGHILASTSPARLARTSTGATGAWLRGELRIPVPSTRRAGNGASLRILGARANNLREVDLDVPLGTLTVVTGVSGSGKSSLIFDVLRRTVEARLARDTTSFGCDGIAGVEHLDKLVTISQQPIGRTPRSNPATYTGLFDLVRDLFAETPEARARGYAKGRFSFNIPGGRCEACEGAGVKTVEMQFLPDVEVPCEVCEGRRFHEETLEITWKGLNVAQVLDLPIERALEHFSAIPRLQRSLQTLVDVGLGYVALGQPSTTLSGGEAQRVKLATELQRPSTGRTLYLLDEPTTGLHVADVVLLLAALQRLVDQGNTVLVVEHHHDLIKCADHLVDLGPEGGREGGRIVAVGTPEEVSRRDTPTGRALARLPDLAGLDRTQPAMVADVPVAAYAAPPDRLEIRGARIHNLKGVDVDVQHGSMTVITGPSGSGKTSLAFDTIFSEGQRRYVESLSTYARRFLGRVERAPVERVDGLKPAIAIDQKSASHNPRSTVATVTEIHDVLRILWARVGLPHCPICGQPLEGRDPSRAAAWLAANTSGVGWLVCRLRPSEIPDERRQALVRDGWVRLLDPSHVEVELQDVAANTLLSQGAWLVLDRLAPGRTARARLAEAIRTGYLLGGGVVTFITRQGNSRWDLTELPTCASHGAPLAEAVTPRHFSFNARLGACTTCDGLGSVRRIAKDKLFPGVRPGLWEGMDGRVSAHLKRTARSVALVEAAAKRLGIGLDAPVATWTPTQERGIMDGFQGDLTIRWTDTWGSTTRTVTEDKPWIGLRAILAGWNTTLEWAVDAETCPTCHGGRLKSGLLAVKLGDMSLPEFSGLTIDTAREVARAWRLEGERAVVAERARLELDRRLTFLVDVGLGYLTLDRQAETLSGGESQRIRLASQLGSQLTGVIYVLDEPTVGLHPRDTDRLVRTLEGLRDLGNTVVVVEHDPDTILRADRVIDLGPGAGRHGGELLAVGSPAELMRDPKSLTGAWLSGAKSIPAREVRRTRRSTIRLSGVTHHNLRDVTVEIPTGLWTAITGVSGSGKSTLIMDSFAPALLRHLGQTALVPAGAEITVMERVDRLVLVDQQPIGRTPRSTPATFTGIFDALRKLFAETLGARERGWTAGRFSFNTEGGRCSACEGRGATLVEMHFLPDVWVVCESCKGRRYNRDTLAVRWKGFNIADVLAMRADEALVHFATHRGIQRKLQALVDVGLGYLELGQPGTTLSGGEAQRVKLAAELVSRAGHAVYILDEPTTGLHLSDVASLVGVLHALVDQGHTVVTIEHHTDMIAQADHVVDLGPDGGAAGGRIVGTGTPEQVAALDTPTGEALRRAIRRRA